MSYVIAEEQFVKREYPEFQASCLALEDLAVARAETLWSGYMYGRFSPGAREFGRTTWLPPFLADQAGDVLDRHHLPATWGVDSFRQLFTATSPTALAIPGWKILLQGGNPLNIGTVPQNILFALAGWALPSKAQLITKLRPQIGDRKLPKIDIEETRAYCERQFIYEEGYIADPEEGFEINAFFEASGYIRAVPKGFNLYKVKDLVVLP